MLALADICLILYQKGSDQHDLTESSCLENLQTLNVQFFSVQYSVLPAERRIR